MNWQQVVRDWLEKEERSQAYLARKARVDMNYLSAILNDLRHPGHSVLGRLDTAMGLEPGTLLTLQAEEQRQGAEVGDGHAD